MSYDPFTDLDLRRGERLQPFEIEAAKGIAIANQRR
jgi:hypothetical protein